MQSFDTGVQIFILAQRGIILGNQRLAVIVSFADFSGVGDRVEVTGSGPDFSEAIIQVVQGIHQTVPVRRLLVALISQNGLQRHAVAL